MMTNDLRAQAIDRLNSIPRLAASCGPTPIEELPRLRAALGRAPRILIKRDDYLGPGFGGNKVRKLEYLLAEAQAAGATVVITCGGVKSNHARVTAALCARLGLRCELVLNPAAVMVEGLEPASLRLDRLYGARLHLRTRAEREATMARLAADYQRAGERVVTIPLGASVPGGALGLVRGAGEAAAQLRELGVEVDALYHCSSSGGTQAGLLVGQQLFAGLAREVIGVSPDGTVAEIAATVAGIVRGVGELLGLPPSTLDERAVVLADYVGAGYGLPTPEGEAALELLARTEGIILDPVYTAKALAGLLDRIRRGLITPEQTVLFWHTGGQLALFYAPKETDR